VFTSYSNSIFPLCKSNYPATPTGSPDKRRIVFSKQIHAILIHADPFTPGMLGQGAMQTLRNAEFELAGVVLQIIRFVDCNPLFQSCGNPLPLCVHGIRDSSFHRLATGDAPRKLRKRHNITALIAVLYNLHAVRQGKIFIQCFH